MAPMVRAISTRFASSVRRPTISAENNVTSNGCLSKRKAESSPPKNGNFKRPALNEITNDGKTAKLKSAVKNAKSSKPNPEVLASKPPVKSNSSVSETRARSSKLATGIRIQKPLRSTSNVYSSQNGEFTDHNALKSKPSNKIMTRSSIAARPSICPTSKIQKPVKPVRNSVSDTCKALNSSTNPNYVKPTVVLPKLSERSSTSSVRQNRDVNIRRSLRNHIEKNEISVQSLIPVFEANKEDQPSVPAEAEPVAKLRRSLRISANQNELSQTINEEQISETKCETTDPGGMKLRRSLRNLEKSEVAVEIVDDLTCEEQSKKCNEESAPVIKLRRSSRNAVDKNEVSFQIYVENPSEPEIKIPRRSSRLSLRKSLPSDKSTDNGSLYVSALEDISFKEAENDRYQKRYAELSEFDKELLNDPQQVALYAMEIFDYLKSREAHFPILDYMHRQPYIDRKMRAMLVDWMVEVQENFELNHETLYLSVKLLDSYLSYNEVKKDSLQLLGAAALFLSCKYDERLSPLSEEFEYVGDGAYDKTRLLTMEQNILRCVNYELSFPISYSFLRRYARCARIQMPLLTLARYILELGLLEYETISLSDSKQAAAALYLAFQMVKHSKWTDSLRYYTGYNVDDFKDIVILFNRILHQKPSPHLMTIRNKYSHELFFEVARIPLLNSKDLNLDV